MISFLIFVDEFLVSALTLRSLVFDDTMMHLHDFTHRGNKIIQNFPNLLRYHFSHGFLMCFGFGFGSILAPFA